MSTTGASTGLDGAHARVLALPAGASVRMSLDDVRSLAHVLEAGASTEPGTSTGRPTAQIEHGSRIDGGIVVGRTRAGALLLASPEDDGSAAVTARDAAALVRNHPDEFAFLDLRDPQGGPPSSWVGHSLTTGPREAPGRVGDVPASVRQVRLGSVAEPDGRVRGWGSVLAANPELATPELVHPTSGPGADVFQGMEHINGMWVSDFATSEHGFDHGEAERLSGHVRRGLDWFRTRHGFDLDAAEPVRLNINHPWAVGNASMNFLAPELTLGPLRGRAAEAALRDGFETLSSKTWEFKHVDARTAARLIPQIANVLDEVVGHELGHHAHVLAWGPHLPPRDAPRRELLAHAEWNVVEEAVGDLYGAAYVDGRGLGRPREGQHRWRTLEAFRRHVATRGVRHTSVSSQLRWGRHDGTHLLTDPVTAFANRVGWGAAGEAVHACVLDVGRRLGDGRTEHVSFPDVADGIKRAAAVRRGWDDPGVRLLVREFAKRGL